MRLVIGYIDERPQLRGGSLIEWCLWTCLDMYLMFLCDGRHTHTHIHYHIYVYAHVCILMIMDVF